MILAFDRDTWIKKFQSTAYQAVFCNDPSDQDPSLFDYALIGIDEETDLPISYVTCKQLNAHTMFLEYGGVAPEYRNTPKSQSIFIEAIKYLQKAGAKIINFATTNDNVKMQILGLKAGFKCMGCYMDGSKLFLEYSLYQGEN